MCVHMCNTHMDLVSNGLLFARRYANLFMPDTNAQFRTSQIEQNIVVHAWLAYNKRYSLEIQLQYGEWFVYQAVDAKLFEKNVLHQEIYRYNGKFYMHSPYFSSSYVLTIY